MAEQNPLAGNRCMQKKLERIPDDLTTEQTIMGQPENQRQDANEDRSAIKEQATIQVLPRTGCGGAFIGFILPKRELQAGQVHRNRQHRVIDAGDREPPAIIVGRKVDGQGKQERDQEILAKE